MFQPDVTLQLDLAFRLVVAAVLGALVGLEREIHAHPAGMRTHLLVSLGSAMFTVLSIHGFIGVLDPGQGAAPDPTRIAAQIVSGIGFLGAGAIIKYGTSIRGLTTAGEPVGDVGDRDGRRGRSAHRRDRRGGHRPVLAVAAQLADPAPPDRPGPGRPGPPPA